MSGHVIQWVAPAPLWPQAGDTEDAAERGVQMRRPALLTFDSDRFMEDLQALLDRQPTALAGQVAVKRSYRMPPPGESDDWQPDLSNVPLKLYQPLHGHFTLVAATLSCRQPGLPEHLVDRANGEVAAFVLRRLHDDVEHAWVPDLNARGGRTWQAIDPQDAGTLAGDEELLPLFPVNYAGDDRTHRLHVGLVPTASREAFLAAGPLSPVTTSHGGLNGNDADLMLNALDMRACEPLDALRDPAIDLMTGSVATAARAQRVEASAFLLVDLAELLEDANSGVVGRLKAGTPQGASEQTLSTTLSGHHAEGSTTWLSALTQAWDERLGIAGEPGHTSSLAVDLHGSDLDGATLRAAALPVLHDGVAAGGGGGTATAAPAVPKLEQGGDATYQLRCVYRRPQCLGACPDVLSDPTEPFALAGFFDFDAPGRSIQVHLPVDTSLKDLRKYRRNVTLLLSNQLRQQMSRVKDLDKAMKKQLESGDTYDLGLVCSFSIPIITICALIVLMIFISLLNIVFWWMPFLRICLPIGIKGRSS